MLLEWYVIPRYIMVGAVYIDKFTVLYYYINAYGFYI